MTKRGRGRPDKLTRELSNRICKLMLTGNYLETAAAAVGVSPTSVRTWLRKGAKEKRGVHCDFLTAYKESEAKSEAAAVARIRQHGAAQWQAEAWWLERRFPTKYGRWQRPDSGEGDIDSVEYVVNIRRRDTETTTTGEGDE